MVIMEKKSMSSPPTSLCAGQMMEARDLRSATLH
jgi:hypothetical protein